MVLRLNWDEIVMREIEWQIRKRRVGEFFSFLKIHSSRRASRAQIVANYCRMDF